MGWPVVKMCQMADVSIYPAHYPEYESKLKVTDKHRLRVYESGLVDAVTDNGS
jgi:hypothetical protein